ncbi:hypothetical protein PQR67_24630 [Paraburkholderia fungorum]|uniref:hypothetical protein n=1 Tax=Paraburkholderia fungorum TaxID=134537 RepID=UPI0038B9E610
MPTVTCHYGDLSAEGANAADRNAVDVSTPIKLASIGLFNYMAGVNVVFPPRSAFACAEAHALSQVLSQRPKTQAVVWTNIKFSAATSDGGVLLWQPCANCCTWLSSSTNMVFVPAKNKKGGTWVSDGKTWYGLSKTALERIAGPAKPAKALDINDTSQFPSLQAATKK